MVKNHNSVGKDLEEVKEEYYTSEEIKKCKKKVNFHGIFIRIRKALGLTQRQLADISNVKQPMLARFETGENIPKVSTVCKILKPLGLTLAIINNDSNKIIYKFDTKEDDEHE